VTTLALGKYFPYRLTVLATRIAKTFASRHIARYGISIPEWRALMTISHLREASPGEVSNFTEMDKAKVTRATTRLIALGLVRSTADPGDGRRSTLTLTRRGQRMHEEILPIALSVEKELLSVLDRSERQALDAILFKLDSKIREMSAGSDNRFSDADI